MSTGQKYSIQDIKKILETYKSLKKPSPYRVSLILKKDRDAVSRVIYNKDYYTEHVERMKFLQDIIAPKLVHDTHLSGDFIISADYHIPCVDLNLIHKMIEEAHKEKIDKLLIAGDLFNYDSLSYYAINMGGDEKIPKMKDEIRLGLEVLQLLSKHFKQIYYLMGNHEKRVENILHNTFSYKLIVDSFKIPQLYFIPQYFCYVDNVRITHPKTYSQTKLSVAMRLCDKYNCDVVQAHGHFLSVGYSRGGYRAIDLPTMADWERINYMTQQDTTYPFWNKGYLIYKNKQFYIRGKGYGVE